MRVQILGLGSVVLLCGSLTARGQTFTPLVDPLANLGPTEAYGISGSNVVGYYEPSGGFIAPEADSGPGTTANGFIYNINTNSYSSLYDPLATEGTYAYGIDGSNVVGSYENSNGVFGFLYNGNTYTTLSDPLATPTNEGTQARGISGNDVVGTYFGSDNRYHGFLYNINTNTYTTLDYPNPSGDSAAFGISANNVVGEIGNDDGPSYLYNISANTYTSLAVPLDGGFAYGIDGGNIVGYYDSGGSNGFLYDGGTFTTIDDPSAVNTTLTDISGNNIVGYAGGSGTSIYGVIVSVPEPSPAYLVVVTALGLFARRRASPADR